MTFSFLKAKERLIRIMGTFDLATGHADTFDELLDSLESELRDVLRHYREAVKEPLTQEPIAMLERIPRLGILRVTYEDAVTELHEGLYPLYVKPQIEVGCAECGVNGGHALYCVACAEKFVGGYKDSGVPAVETGLEQVSPDTQLVRADAMEVATRAANESWTLACKKMVEFEREACAKVCEQPIDEIQITDTISEVVYMDAHECAAGIRARGNT